MIELEPVKRLRRDEAQASVNLDDQQVRYLVDSYYQMQANRIRSDNQVRSMTETEEPNTVLQWLADQNAVLEKQIQRSLDVYSKNHLVGSWLRSVDGIGPVIAAGLLAHIDIHKAPTAGHIWSYAGLDTSAMWLGGKGAEAAVSAFVDKKAVVSVEDILHIAAEGKGCAKWLARRAVRAASNVEIPTLGLEHRTSDMEYVSAIIRGHDIRKEHLILALSKRPWNADLKRLVWLVGESFVKVSGKESAFYGRIYAQRKVQETAKNTLGEYSGQAEAILDRKKFDKTTDAYKAYSKGALPPAHIHARAKRYAVKRLLSDLHVVWYWKVFDKLPPNPYAIAHLGHAHHEISPTLANVPDLWKALLASGAVPTASQSSK